MQIIFAESGINTAAVAATSIDYYKKPQMANGAPTTICGTIWSSLLATAATVILLVFGILALVPGGPFDSRHLTAGIVMVVLAGTGVAGLAGAAIGFGFGAALGAPLECCV